MPNTQKSFKSPEVLKISKKQTGMPSNIAIDKAIKALYPGKRRSKPSKKYPKGNIYWENRPNRSDINPAKGL
jgi:hypothetical protein|tara:strand:+ start:31 stop:246 length:216 start_codon:yes stop_codon:yes gene_type:complete